MDSIDVSREASHDITLQTFRQAVENTGHSVYWTDVDGTIEYVNPAFEEQTGYTAAEAIGSNASLLQSGVHDESFYKRLWKTILGGNVWRGEIVNERKNGTRYVVNQTISPITDSDGDLVRFVAANEEITELRAYQDKAERERDRLQTVLDAVPIPLVVTQFVQGDPLTKQVNREFEDVFGLSEQHLLESSLDEYIVDDTDEQQASEINDHLRHGDSVRREVTRTTADGESRTFLLEATPLSDTNEPTDEALGTYLDITERKRTQNKRTLLTEVSHGIGAAETFEEGLEQTLKVICTYTEWACGEVWQPVDATEDLEFVVGYSDAADCFPFLNASESVTFPPGEGLPGRVYESGSIEWIPDVSQEPPEVFHRTELANDADLHAAVGLPISTNDGVVAVLVFFLQEPRSTDEKLIEDINDIAANLGGLVARKHAEEMIKRRNERLEDFASVLSHDLRNPLNVAKGHLELVEAERDSPHIETIATAHDRMQELIEDMLTLARQGTAITELNPVVLAECVEYCRHTIDTTTATITNETTKTVRADESRIQQSFENLLRNAIDHAPEGVTITVGDMPDGFYVADDGPGIPADERDTIFEVGYTTAESGTGFGLPIIKEIVEAHGWRIAVTDSATGGARFEITGVETVDT